MEREYKYSAYIAYSREDEELAKHLQCELERYTFPSNITKCNDLQKELKPIHCHAWGLINESLLQTVIETLAVSRHLIVICSPCSAKNDRVNKEVEAFVAIGKQDFIIPFIIDSNTYYNNHSDECFPPAVRKLLNNQYLPIVNSVKVSFNTAVIRIVSIMFSLQFDDLLESKRHEYRRCSNGHFFRGEKCPYCKTVDSFFSNSYHTPSIISAGGKSSNCDGKFKTTIFCDEGVYASPPSRDRTRDRTLVGCLVSYSLDSKGVDYKLYEGRNIIGRNSDCNITINDSLVSDSHAVLLYRAGKYSIFDQMSSHGTFVNGEDIELKPRYLSDGDIVTIGRTKLLFRSFFDITLKNEEKPRKLINNNDFYVTKDTDKCMLNFNEQMAYSSVFAPAEVKPMSHMLVQVYLHLYEETEMVKNLAQESDKKAERRGYIPLQCILKKGDRVDVLLNIYGETLLMSDVKIIIWQGHFTNCSFGYFVPKDIDVDELSCVALLSVNGVPVGEMRFITKIVEYEPRQLNPEIIAQKYKKAFISYAHQDKASVKSFHDALDLYGIEHFFDRSFLMPGDVFPQVIQDYINTADLFVLFWSENAANSVYVEKERKQALELAFPQVKPQEAAKLRIYPISIEPRAELPSDMKDNYHFGEI